MRKQTEKTEEFLNMMVDWQEVESKTIEYANKEIPNSRNALIKTMLKVLKLEAEKHCVMEQMIVESIKKEAVHLSPEELDTLSGHINKCLKLEEKALERGQEAMGKSGLFMSRYLLSYLISDLKKEQSLLRQFDDELKMASIPTSVTSKIYATDGK